MFVYDRADNTRLTMEALMANTLAPHTDVYVFSDGGRDAASWQRVRQVRAYLHAIAHRVEHSDALHSLTLVERPVNYYLERNITEGIAQVFQQHDRIIVLEDDIVTSPHYLEYMNQALRLYADVPRVMHVSGFTNLDIIHQHEFYFTPHMSGWGWGTWRQRWQQHFRHYTSAAQALQGLSAAQLDAIQYGGVFPCLRSLQRDPIPWDVCWELAIHRCGGLCLTPGHTLVRNVGLASGTHFRSWSLLQHYEYDRPPLQRPLQLSRIDAPVADPSIERQFAQAITDWGIRYTPLGRIVRWVYRRVTRRDS